jgi:hypothetical protein
VYLCMYVCIPIWIYVCMYGIYVFMYVLLYVLTGMYVFEDVQYVCGDVEMYVGRGVRTYLSGCMYVCGVVVHMCV